MKQQQVEVAAQVGTRTSPRTSKEFPRCLLQLGWFHSIMGNDE